MRRAIRWTAGLFAGIAVLLVIAAILVVWLSRSQFGKERVRRIALDWLEDNVAGEVTLGRFTGGGLFEGLTVHEFAIHDSLGRPFVKVDSLSAGYDILDLLRGRISIGRIEAWGPVIHIERLPGDSLWNYERLFPSSPDEPPGTPRLIAFDHVRLHDAAANVRLPYEGSGDEAFDWVLEDAPGGTLRTIRFDSLQASLDHVRWESPSEPGRRIDIAELSGRAFVFRDAARIKDLAGTVTIVDSIASIDLRKFALPETHGKIEGRIVMNDDGERYDIRIDADRYTLHDMQWIHARIPAQGEGRAIVRITSENGGAFTWRAEDFTFDAPGTSLAGAAGVATGESLSLRDVDVRASPLDLTWLESTLGRDIPIAGTVAGTLTADGPLSSVQTSGDVRLASASGNASIRWTGNAALSGEIAVENLRADIASLDLRLVRAVQPAFPLDGRVSGRLELDGRLDQWLDVRSILTHQLGTGETTRLDGGGVVSQQGGAYVFDLAFDADPLALVTLARTAPSLERLSGEARGHIALAGTIDSLHVNADIVTAGGPLIADATIDRRGSSPRFVIQAATPGFDMAPLGLLSFETWFAGSATAQLEGSALDNLQGPVRVALDSAHVRGVPIQAAQLSASLASGTVRIDTAIVRSAGLTAEASGVLGLVAEQQGQVRMRVTGESLEALEAPVFGSVLDPTAPRIGGKVELEGTLSGSIEALDIAARVRLDRFFYESQSVAHADVAVTGQGLGSPGGTLRARAAFDSLRVADKGADSASITLEYSNGRVAGDAETWASGETALRVAGAFESADSARIIGLTELRFRSADRVWALADTATIRLANGIAQVEPVRIAPVAGAGVLHAEGTVAWEFGRATSGRALDFDLALEGMPFGELLALLSTPVEIEGDVSGTIRVAGTTAAPTLDADVTLLGVRYQNASLERVVADVAYGQGTIDATTIAFIGGRDVLSGSGTIPFDLAAPAGQRRPDREIEFTAQLDSFPAAFTLGPISGFTDVAGVIDGTFQIGGTSRDPNLSGALLLRRGAASVGASGVRYVDAEGTMRMNRELLVDIDLTASTAEPRGDRERVGTARVTGSIDLSSLADPGLDLTIHAQQIMAARRRDVDADITGSATITGSYRAPLVSGDITIDRANLYLDEIYRQYLIVQLEDPLLFNVIDTSLVSVRRILPESENPFVRNLRIENMTVAVSPGTWVRSREMDVEVSGNLNVTVNRQRQDMVLSGTLDVIRGSYRLTYPGIPFARVFEVREGTINFAGTQGFNPNLQITAAYTAPARGGEPLEISAVVSGSLGDLRVSLQSDADPPISESDLASYLFFGAPTYAIGVGSSRGVESLGSGLFAATGLGYFASGLQTLAQNFGIVDYVGVTAAEAGTPGSQTGLGGLFANTRIELGRYLSPRLFVAYTQRLASAGSGAGVRLEWRLTPTYTLELFAEDRFARSTIVGLSQALEARKIYGFFLYREWSY
ncbi:MAG: translocation/assembly module TamB domain-containing protein [Longimicrobiales bacterium]